MLSRHFVTCLPRKINSICKCKVIHSEWNTQHVLHDDPIYTYSIFAILFHYTITIIFPQCQSQQDRARLIGASRKRKWQGSMEIHTLWVCAVIYGDVWLPRFRTGHDLKIKYQLSRYRDTVETLYSTIYYSKYFIELNFDKSTQYVAPWTHKRHPIPRPFGRAMECLLWVLEQKLIVL